MGFVWRVKVASRRESPCLSQHPRLCGWRVCRVRALPVHRRVSACAPGFGSALSPGSACADVRVCVWVYAPVSVSGSAFVSICVCVCVSVCWGRSEICRCFSQGVCRVFVGMSGGVG